MQYSSFLDEKNGEEETDEKKRQRDDRRVCKSSGGHL